jgi:hypothetical protein
LNKNNKKVLERTRLQAASIFVDDAALGDEGMSLGVGVGVTAEGDELATGGAGDGGSGNSKISTILML